MRRRSWKIKILAVIDNITNIIKIHNIFKKRYLFCYFYIYLRDIYFIIYTYFDNIEFLKNNFFKLYYNKDNQ